MGKFRFVVLPLILVLVLTASLGASGFAIYEHGIRANGLAGAFGGIGNDASLLYYNPAGISFLSAGKHLSLGTTFILPKFSWESLPGYTAQKVDMNDKIFFPSNLHYVVTGDGALSYGIAFFNPFGLGTDWPDGWPGRFNIVNVNIETFFLQPTVSYKVQDNLSVAFGIDLVFATANMKKRADLLGIQPEPLADISGSGTALGFNAALAYKVNDELSAGITYRSGINIEMTGDAVFTDTDGVDALATGLFPGGDVTLDIPTPTTIGLGVGYQLSDKLGLDVDFTWVGWSTFDTLTIAFATHTALPSGTQIQGDQHLVEEWEDVSNIRIGATYQINDEMEAQFGFLIDSNPAQDEYLSPMLPDMDRKGVSFGLSKKLNENMMLNFSYIHLFLKERTIENSMLDSPFNGVYNGRVELIGFGLNYDF